MRFWVTLLMPLFIWLLHFHGVYTAAEFAPLSLPVVMPVLTVVALLALAIAAKSRSYLIQWQNIIFSGGALLALIAIIWQTLPQFL